MLLSQTIQLITYFPQAKDFTNLQGVKTHQLFERLHSRSQIDPPGRKGKQENPLQNSNFWLLNYTVIMI